MMKGTVFWRVVFFIGLMDLYTPLKAENEDGVSIIQYNGLTIRMTGNSMEVRGSPFDKSSSQSFSSDAIFIKSANSLEGVNIHGGAIVSKNAVLHSGAVIHGGAIISSGAIVHPGAIICGGTIISSGAIIYDHALISGGAIIGADAVVSKRAVVCGDVIVSKGAVISEGAVVPGGTIVPKGAIWKARTEPDETWSFFRNLWETMTSGSKCS